MIFPFWGVGFKHKQQKNSATNNNNNNMEVILLVLFCLAHTPTHPPSQQCLHCEKNKQ